MVGRGNRVSRGAKTHGPTTALVTVLRYRYAQRFVSCTGRIAAEADDAELYGFFLAELGERHYFGDENSVDRLTEALTLLISRKH